MTYLTMFLATVGAFALIFLGICALVIAGDRTPQKPSNYEDYD